QTQRGEGFHLGLSRHAGLIAVATKLATDEILRPKRRNRLEHLHFFIAYGLAVGAGRRLHREIRQNLKEMILHDIPNDPRLVVETPAPLDTEVLGHGDLYALDMLAVPDRLQERVGEPEEQHVAHRSLAQVVIDAEDMVLVERPQQDSVEGLRRCQIMAKRLLD